MIQKTKVHFRILMFLFLLSPITTLAQKKITGVNYVAENSFVNKNAFDDLKVIGAKWVAWIPYALCDDKSGHLSYNNKWQWKGESPEGTRWAIQQAKKKRLKVMVKPHVWMSNQSFTGTLKLDSTAWVNWKKDYLQYILGLAKIANEEKADMFCIGTEQGASVAKHPEFWLYLIQSVRKVFKGKLTYAGNWDNYKNCMFWSQLDYIGIDAYFPISDIKNPTPAQFKTVWAKWKTEINGVQQKYKKPILFTEYGYRTTEFATKNPWEDNSEAAYSEIAQSQALQALYSEFWDQKWFAGGFLWKWYEGGKSFKYANKKAFYVHGKKAVKTILKTYTK